MKVLVYVEGPSDRFALDALIAPIVRQGSQHGVGIRFIELQNKASVLNDAPRKAAFHLAENPKDWVFALPDLYPMSCYDDTPNAHRSFEQLKKMLLDRFASQAQRVKASPAVHTHFRVHCLKHDLEALLLAAPDELRQRLKTQDALKNRWRRLVEEQDDRRPPK